MQKFHKPMEAEGHNKREAHGRKIKNPLSDNKSHREENVCGGDEGKDEPRDRYHHLPEEVVRQLWIYCHIAHLERGLPALMVANARLKIAAIEISVSKLRWSEKELMRGIDPMVQSQQRLKGQRSRPRFTKIRWVRVK